MHNYSKTIEETVGNLKEVTPEKIQAFTVETLETLATLGERFKSTDPLEKQAAMEEALELRAILAQQFKALGEQLPKKKRKTMINLVG